MNCIVCFSDYTQSIECFNCNDKMCVECAESYIEFSKKENLLPKCPNCNIYYMPNASNFNKKLSKLYVDACYNFLIKDNKSDVNDDITYLHMINNLRNEKKKYVEEKLQPAIRHIVNIALVKKKNTINLHNKKQIEKKIGEGINRYCMISFCNGRLDKELKCLKCNNQFCKSCEKLKTAHHMCSKEDIESTNFINSLIRCPKCNLPIQKSEGCNEITCANCHTNFNYRTGQKGEFGNHGQYTDVDVQDTYLLSNIYRDFYDGDIISLLQRIEDKHPRTIPFSSIIPLLTKIELTDQKDKYKLELVKKYEKYYISNWEYKKYISIISTIEALHEDSERILTSHYLHVLYQSIEKNYRDKKQDERDIVLPNGFTLINGYINTLTINKKSIPLLFPPYAKKGDLSIDISDTSILNIRSPEMDRFILYILKQRISNISFQSFSELINGITDEIIFMNKHLLDTCIYCRKQQRSGQRPKPCEECINKFKKDSKYNNNLYDDTILKLIFQLYVQYVKLPEKSIYFLIQYHNKAKLHYLTQDKHVYDYINRYDGSIIEQKYLDDFIVPELDYNIELINSILETSLIQSTYILFPLSIKKEQEFLKLKNNNESFFLFHGTRTCNILSILMTDIQVMSGSEYCINGSAFGTGIYMSNQLSMSMQYSDNYIFICEVAGKRSDYKKGRNVYVVDNVSKVRIRFLLKIHNTIHNIIRIHNTIRFDILDDNVQNTIRQHIIY